LLHRRGRSCGGDAPAARDVCLMHYRIVAVGRVRDAALRAACDGYLERLRRYTRVEEREVKDQARILEGVPGGSRLVALSEGGEQWTSEQLADWTARWELDGRDVEPLPADISGRADPGDRVRAAVPRVHHPPGGTLPSRILS